MTTSYAPIALFCFNRPEHLSLTLDSLKMCPEFDASMLHVYSDGPRSENDIAGVTAVRRILATALPPNAVVVARPGNVGLAQNIIEGVGHLCDTYGRVIVLEDDLVLDKRFLTFMNEALDRYADDERVCQVAGHLFESTDLKGRSEAMMLPWPTSWGWATWARAWRYFDPAATGWQHLATNPALRRKFNLDGTYDYATMLERQMTGQIQSWAVRWYWSLFRVGAMIVYPPVNLVGNTGFDGSGTHGRGWMRRFGKDIDAGRPPTIEPIKFPDDVSLDPQICQHVRNAIWHYNGGRLGQFVDSVRRPIGRLVRRLRTSS